MKRTSSIAAAVAVAIASTLLAQSGAAQPKAPSAPSSSAPDVKAFDQRTAEFQAKVKLMQQQMDSLRQTQDPQQRQKLMEEHWATMQSAMSLMHGMWGPGMMGGPGMRGGHGMMGGPGMMGWSGMRGYYSKLTPEQEKQRQYMMDQYTWMQQMMMDQMLQRQQGVSQPPAPPPGK